MLTANRSFPRSRFSISGPVLRAVVTAGCAFALTALPACGSTPSDAEAVGSTASAVAISGLFSTGVDATGKPLAVGTVDPHYVLSSTDLLHPGPNAVVVTPNAAWTPDTATLNWISIQASTTGTLTATYTYTTTFTLTGIDPSTATLSGRWACDDSCALSLNGTLIASATYPASAYGATAAFTVPSGHFKTGANTLAFITVNSGGGPTGLQVVSLSGNASCSNDTGCAANQFCNTQTGVCANKLASGTPIPTITGHTPVLNGKCATGVGAAVCTAAVCDVNDECGLADGDGPCVAAATGSTVCQSGACSTNMLCEPAGGCNVDADCSMGK